MFQSSLSYSILCADYVSFKDNVQDLREINKLSIPAECASKNVSVGQSELFFARGIVYVVYEKLLVAADASIRSLCALGCTLSMEMRYKASETNVDHKVLKLLVAEFAVYLREITDKRATNYHAKLHAIFYSAFDSVLRQKFVVRDPTYLFDSPEFVVNDSRDLLAGLLAVQQHEVQYTQAELCLTGV